MSDFYIILIFCFASLLTGAILGVFLSPKIFKDKFSNMFRDSAKEVLGEVAKGKEKDSLSELDKKKDIISVEMNAIKTSIDEELRTLSDSVSKAKNVWERDTGTLAEGISKLNKSHTAWAEALSNTSVQGNLGEESLKGMLDNFGLYEGPGYEYQATYTTITGEVYRPDFTIKTADGGKIFIDCKVPINAFQEAVKHEDDDEKKRLLKKHAKSVLDHAKALGKKKYQELDSKSPDFTILYLHNVALFLAAVEEMPNIVEEASKYKVIICPPVLVYATLKTIMLAMHQRDIEENAKEIAKAGNELHKRLVKYLKHFSGIERGLFHANSAYNDAISSFKSRLEPQARKFQNLLSHDIEGELPQLKSIDTLHLPNDSKSKNDGGDNE